jgi:hypothetical protein
VSPLLIGPLAEIVKSAIGRIFPDPAAQAEANFKLAVMVQNGQLAEMANDSSLLLAQIAVNKAEAESDSTFKGGWRPGVGWVCVAGLAWNFVARPAVTTVAALCGTPLDLPPADLSDLMPLLVSLLGLGAYRTVEKLKGKQ